MMHIYVKNNPSKFHRNPIWNRALGFFEEVAQRRTRRTRWVVVWDQFQVEKFFQRHMQW